MKQSVLIISYYFPPYKRVGGRRWAKHAKFLNRFGVAAYILAGDFPGSSSSWDDDVLEYQDKVTRIKLDPVYQPYFEKTLPENGVDKIKWKLSYYAWNVRKRFLKGNYTDVSRPNKNKFLENARDLIKEKKIDTVILSVGPFAYSELLIDLKAEFPNIKYVLDYRDPWEESTVGLTEGQKEDEMQKQLEILKTVDLVLTVNADISKHITTIFKNVNVVTLPHCVDDDFLNLVSTNNTPPANNPPILTYGGELYSGLETEMKTFVNFLDLFSEKEKQNCDARFYSPYPSYETIIGNKVALRPTLLKKEYQETLLKSDFILLFKSPLSSGAFFSSKFYEILCIGKPLLFFGNPGQVSDFIENHKLGFHVQQDNLQSVCERIIENRIAKTIPDRNYDLYQHSFEFHTKKLIEDLNKLRRAI